MCLSEACCTDCICLQRELSVAQICMALRAWHRTQRRRISMRSRSAAKRRSQRLKDKRLAVRRAISISTLRDASALEARRNRCNPFSSMWRSACVQACSSKKWRRSEACWAEHHVRNTRCCPCNVDCVRAVWSFAVTTAWTRRLARNAAIVHARRCRLAFPIRFCCEAVPRLAARKLYSAAAIRSATTAQNLSTSAFWCDMHLCTIVARSPTLLIS